MNHPKDTHTYQNESPFYIINYMICVLPYIIFVYRSQGRLLGLSYSFTERGLPSIRPPLSIPLLTITRTDQQPTYMSCTCVSM